jgi:general secretion pathway protein A
VVLIDEAQNLEPTVLEQLRMLSNLETDRGKLLQVVLVGQPELHAKLSTPQMRQLEQRIAVRFHIHELSRTETEQYIVHRLSVAGAAHTVTWTRPALRLIHQHCGGIPRRINVLCDRLLMSAYVHETSRITPRLVRESLQELGGSWHISGHSTGLWRPLLGKGLWTGLAVGGALAFCLGFVLTFSSLAQHMYPRLAEGVSALSRLWPQSAKMLPPENLGPVSTMIPVAVPTQSSHLEPEVDMALVQTLWHLKTQVEDALVRAPQAAVPWHTLLHDIGSTTSVEVVSLPAKAWHLQNVSRPCLVEVVYETTVSRSTLWVLAKVVGEQAWLYQEPEGVVRMPLRQVQERWAGKLYLTVESGKYRGFALRPGMQGERVRVLQETLREKGYFTGIPSGQFDAQTQQAVKRFQRDNQLLTDGYVGRQTLVLLLHFGGDMLAQLI